MGRSGSGAASTGGQESGAAAVQGRAPADPRQTNPPADKPSMQTKRKLDVCEAAPSPRRVTRASSKSEDLQNAEVPLKRRTGSQEHGNDVPVHAKRKEVAQTSTDLKGKCKMEEIDDHS